jgi:lysosomal alpha-mannosidase
MSTNGTWWTDSNGRDSDKRVFNYRPSWNYTVEEPVAGNYVPINAFIYTTDISTGQTLSVMTDRSQGGASLADGELEVMVQRRLQHDDNRGVGEPLNETGLDGNGLIVRTVHCVSLDPSTAAAGVTRRTALADLMWRNLARFAPMPSGVSPAQWVSTYKPTFSGVTAALPANVHLLTVHSWSPTTLLVRLSHSYETGEGGAMSQPATVNLAGLFSGITLQSCTETTLTANQPLASAPKWTYNVTGGPVSTLPVVYTPPQGAQMSVTLNPMDIRTFLCTTSPQNEQA